MELDETKVVHEVSYAAFIAGALLVLPNIDLYDEIALCKELRFDLRNHNKTRVAEYIKETDNGIIALKDGITLDGKIEGGCTLRKKLEEIAGPKVLMAFQSFNAQRYILSKQKMLVAKQEIIDKAGVLLISENEETYLGLREYGFKNIDYFKSAVRADKYFKKHPEELKKYHLILMGKRSISGCNFDNRIKLDDTIRNLKYNTGVVVESRIESIISSNDIKYETRLKGDWNDPFISSKISDVLDVIVNYMLAKDTLRKVGYKGEFKPIEDLIADRLPLPSKKSDLKILCLDYFYELCDERTLSLINSTGLNITFRNDDNYALDKIKDKLGEYDIIIASESYSRNLLNMAVESTEQCKDTGRGLILLATYESIGTIILKYVYAGNLAPKVLSDSVITDEFDVLIDDMGKNLKGFAIISAAIHAYNKCLPTPLVDLDLKSPEEYNQEYKNMREEKDRKERAEWESIHLFDKMMSILENYLNYRNRVPVERNSNGRAIIEKGNGLKIRVLENGIVLENYYHGKINFAISLPMLYRPNDYRVFSIRIGDSCFQSASLYVGEKKNQSLPPKANNYQLRVLSAFIELVEKTLLLLPLAEQQKQDSGSVKK